VPAEDRDARDWREAVGDLEADLGQDVEAEKHDEPPFRRATPARHLMLSA
jgi:hypothetical protein